MTVDHQEQAVEKSYIHIRVDKKVKDLIQAAAKRNRTSITSFMLKAATAAAKDQQESQALEAELFGGVPSYFQACCAEASRGGGLSYEHPGYHLAIDIMFDMPLGADVATWSSEIKKFNSYLEFQDDESVWKWLQKWYPDHMKLIPRRRRKTFIRGIVSGVS